jgi:hypothetical protein
MVRVGGWPIRLWGERFWVPHLLWVFKGAGFLFFLSPFQMSASQLAA